MGAAGTTVVNWMASTDIDFYDTAYPGNTSSWDSVDAAHQAAADAIKANQVGIALLQGVTQPDADHPHFIARLDPDYQLVTAMEGRNGDFPAVLFDATRFKFWASIKENSHGVVAMLENKTTKQTVYCLSFALLDSPAESDVRALFSTLREQNLTDALVYVGGAINPGAAEVLQELASSCNLTFEAPTEITRANDSIRLAQSFFATGKGFSATRCDLGGLNSFGAEIMPSPYLPKGFEVVARGISIRPSLRSADGGINYMVVAGLSAFALALAAIVLYVGVRYFRRPAVIEVPQPVVDGLKAAAEAVEAVTAE